MEGREKQGEKERAGVREGSGGAGVDFQKQQTGMRLESVFLPSTNQ